MTFHSAPGGHRYQSTLVPLMFAPCARQLVAQASLPAGARVLELATGTGIVARTAAAALGPAGHVLAIDATEGMLAAAREQPAAADAAPIEYRLAMAEDAVLPEATFDAAFCQQGLQFFDDPVRALEQVRRALKPGRHLHLAVWGPLEQNALSLAMQHALTECGLKEATWLLDKPHRLADAAAVRGLLAQAGFALEREHAVTLQPDGPWSAEDGPRILDASPLSTRLASLSEEEYARLGTAMTRALARCEHDGALRLHFLTHLYTARTPQPGAQTVAGEG